MKVNSDVACLATVLMVKCLLREILSSLFEISNLIGVSVLKLSRIWQSNKLLFVVAISYVFFLNQTISARGLFDYIGNDYRAFRASAEISELQDFARVYDLDEQKTFQRKLYAGYSGGYPQRSGFETSPVWYLPVFLLPFRLLLLFNPLVGFILYSAANILLLIWSIKRLLSSIESDRLVDGIIAFVLISMPFLLTVQFGQVNILLLIVVVEAVIALSQKKETIAGMLFGVLLLKPQILILLIPGLVIGKHKRILMGFTYSSIILIASSYLLVGQEGLLKLAEIFRLYPTNRGNNIFPESMMNWRAVALNLEATMSEIAAWSIAGLAMVLTSTMALLLWRVKIKPWSPEFAIVLLGTFSSTLVVTWHSHVHMALPLVPLLIFLVQRNLFSWEHLKIWVLIPVFVFIPIALQNIGEAHNLLGLTFLALNTALAFWSFQALYKKSFFPILSRLNRKGK